MRAAAVMSAVGVALMLLAIPAGGGVKVALVFAGLGLVTFAAMLGIYRGGAR